MALGIGRMASRQRSAEEKGLQDQMNILPKGKLMVVFGSLALTLLISFIDQNGVGVMLPTVAADLSATDTISWAGTSSLIANTTFQMLYGRLSDIFGRKSVYLGAIASLSLAALLCGLSQNAAMLYVFRGVAGVGGGGIGNLSMIIVSDIVTLEQRGKYQGILGSCIGLGNVAGPFLAAAFITTGVTWRGFFWLIAPLAAVVGGVAYLLLPPSPRASSLREGAAKIDYGGTLLSSIAVIFLLIPISGGGSYFDWASPMVISMLVIGSLSLAAFVLWEAKFARLPMMPTSLFRNPVVVVLLGQSFLLGAVYQSYLYYLPLFLQNARQFSVLESAGLIACFVSCQSIFSIISGQYISRVKRYGEVIWAGFGIWTLGSGLMLLFTRETSPGVIAVPFLLVGMGVGFVFQPTLVALQSHVTKARRAVIISNRNFARCAGGACGLAVSAAVLQATLRAHLPPTYAYLARNTYAVPHDLRDGSAEAEAVLDAYMAASRAVFILQVPLIGFCFLCTAFVRDRGLQPLDEQQQQVAPVVSGPGYAQQRGEVNVDTDVSDSDGRSEVDEISDVGGRPGHRPGDDKEMPPV